MLFGIELSNVYDYIASYLWLLCLSKKRSEILTKNTLGVKKSCGQELEKGLDEKEVKSKMGGQGLCSATTDQNKILIITSQAAKH